jgi:hypothetical protein
MDSWLDKSGSSDFHSFSIAKMLIALASAGRMDNLAASFIR